MAVAGLLLPVRGVRRRVRLEKQREIEWCRNALREHRASRDAGADQRAGRLADVLAYRDHVEAVREWPFDTAAWLRFGLYLLIPVGSWLGGALVERVIDALLK